MVKVETEIVINSSIENIWNILTDFNQYPLWNPLIKNIKGNLVEGETLKIHVTLPNQMGMRFKPIITKVDFRKEFVWKGKFLFEGLFDGEHFFRLETVGTNQTKLIHGENFSGFLVPYFKKMLANTKEGSFPFWIGK